MKTYKVLIEVFASTDTKGIKEMQKKLNQWMTTGLLVKYEIHPSNGVYLFNVCLKKDA
jgi:hypothetical protein